MRKKNWGKREWRTVTALVMTNDWRRQRDDSRFGKSVIFIFLVHRDYCTGNKKEIINELLYTITLWISAPHYTSLN